MNRHALLNTLEYVDVTSGAFIPDIMHDILEGVLPLEIKLMLKASVLIVSNSHTSIVVVIINVGICV